MVDTIFSAMSVQGDDHHIEIWKIKKLITKLDTCKGNGTSFVSLYIPPKESMNLVVSKLT